SGDLYPVIKPSTIHTAFLSTSSFTWHQRLRHPGDEVLCSFVSRRFISCNKEKSTHICHACQLGKHVKLPFHSFDSIVEHCFDIIHFDSWTSPIVDVKNAFLNGDLSETVYMHQPSILLILASSTTLLQQIINSLHSEFDMTNLGALNYFLGISAVRHSIRPEGISVQDPTLYRSLAGGLQYLTFTRPGLSYAVQQVCLYMHDPREPHFAALKRIVRYIRETIDFGLHVYTSSTTFLVGYMDADWAGFPSTRRSTSGYCVFLGDDLLSWSSKRQHTLSRSSAEAEYRGIANVVAKTAWLCNLLRELHSPLSSAILVYYDNVSAIYMSVNPVQHQRTKHIEIDIHFVCDMVTARQVRVLHVPSRYQHANIFTKELPLALFEEFRSSLSARPPPALTARAYYVWDVLVQSKFSAKTLERAHMQNCNMCRTYVDTESKLGPDGCCVFLGDNLLSCSAKRQVTLYRSSDETEYRGVANLGVETEWIRNVLRELHALLFTTILVYRDNASVMYMFVNPVQHQRTKHIEIDYILSMTL
nr:ribonuclease H-like domain-containing protein [Tanacetum cinerariifolium]